jgi:2'-5' RNA ligase
MSNWFIALPVSAHAWLAQLPDPPHNFRRFHADDVHLTVAFLGMVDESTARRAWAEASAFPAGERDISLGQVLPMGAARRYSALSAELELGRDSLCEAIFSVRDAICDAAQVRRDLRAPRPHVTIARPRRRALPDDLRAGLAWAQELPRGPCLRLTHIALYTWAVERTDRLFRIVESRPLNAP